MAASREGDILPLWIGLQAIAQIRIVVNHFKTSSGLCMPPRITRMMHALYTDNKPATRLMTKDASAVQ